MEPNASNISMKQIDGRLWALQDLTVLDLVEMSAFMLKALDGQLNTNNRPTEMT